MKTGNRQVMDAPCRTANPACVRSHKPQANKELEKKKKKKKTRPVEFIRFYEILLPENLGTH